MKKRAIYIILFLLSVSIVSAQKKNKTFTADGENAIYKSEWSVGMRFHTNAISGFFEYVWIKDIKRRKLIQVNLFGYNDYRDKRIKTIIPAFSQDVTAKKYFYGKKNQFYSIQLMYGYRKVIANKSEEEGVKLAVTYMGGLSIGALKPYYLDLYYPIVDGFEIKSERFSNENEQVFLDKNKIIGSSGFSRGFSKMTFAPGITAKVGLNFDFARKNTLVSSIEVGSQIDVFYKKLDVYVGGNNKPYILNLYLSMQIGNRH